MQGANGGNDAAQPANHQDASDTAVEQDRDYATHTVLGDEEVDLRETYENEKKRQCVWRLMSWYILHCDLIPMKALYDTGMVQNVCAKLNCPGGFDVKYMFGPFLDSMYEACVSTRQAQIANSECFQISVNVKSFKDSSHQPRYVVADSLRLNSGIPAMGGIFNVKKLRNNKEQLQGIMENIGLIGESAKVGGFVVDAGIGRELCRELESTLPSCAAIQCQARALRDLLFDIIQSDMLLQETIQGARKIFEFAGHHNLFAAESRTVWAQRQNALSKAGARKGLVEFAAEILHVQNMQNAICSLINSRTMIEDPFLENGKDMQIFQSESIWNQISMYAKLLEPIIDILCEIEYNAPTLGQMHLIWHYLSRHAVVWQELVERTNGLESCSIALKCTSLHSIRTRMQRHRSAAYHPAFTLGYLLDIRMWKISNGIAKPNTSTLAKDDIVEASKLASRMFQHESAGLEVDQLVQCGIIIDQYSHILFMSQNELRGWRIQSDGDVALINNLTDAWKSTPLQTSLPALSSLVSRLFTMRATSCRLKSMSNLMRWTVKQTDASDEIKMRMSVLALSNRMACLGSLSLEPVEITSIKLFSDYLGLEQYPLTASPVPLDQYMIDMGTTSVQPRSARGTFSPNQFSFYVGSLGEARRQQRSRASIPGACLTSTSTVTPLLSPNPRTPLLQLSKVDEETNDQGPDLAAPSQQKPNSPVIQRSLLPDFTAQQQAASIPLSPSLRRKKRKMLCPTSAQ